MTALLTVFVPTTLHGSVFEDEAIVNGNKSPQRYVPRVYNGHYVVDVPLGFYNRMIGGPLGKDWQDANFEVQQWLGTADRRTMFGNAFPGEHRPPPVPKPEPATVMVKLAAPAGVTSCSIEGKELVIPESGVMTVTDKVADILRSHGFQDAA